VSESTFLFAIAHVIALRCLALFFDSLKFYYLRVFYVPLASFFSTM